MKASGRTGMIAVLLWAISGTCGAGDFQLRIAPVDPVSAEAETTSWDSLGKADSIPDKSSMAMRGPASRALPSGLQARKTEMVRRMLWIVLAYR